MANSSSIVNKCPTQAHNRNGLITFCSRTSSGIEMNYFQDLGLAKTAIEPLPAVTKSNCSEGKRKTTRCASPCPCSLHRGMQAPPVPKGGQCSDQQHFSPFHLGYLLPASMVLLYLSVAKSTSNGVPCYSYFRYGLALHGKFQSLVRHDSFPNVLISPAPTCADEGNLGGLIAA